MSLESGQIMWAGLMPHPPIVVPGVGGGREREAGSTCDAMGELCQRVVAMNPDRLIVISPHSPRRRAMFGVWADARLRGDLGRFNAPEEQIDLPNDLTFVQKLYETANQFDLTLWEIEDEWLDHGAVVPLCYWRDAGWKGPTVIIGLNYPGDDQLEDLGRVIASAAYQLPGKTALLASGDMSHRLKPGAPGGFHPRAHVFDEKFVELVKAGDFKALLTIPADLQDLAGEDVLDSSLIAMAAMDYRSDHHEVLSYEGPFGVGYCIAQFCCIDSQTQLIDQASQHEHEDRGKELVRLARQAVESYVRDGVIINPPRGAVAAFHFKPSGVFVTLRTGDGQLRGCIGTLRPRHQTVEEEVIDRAIAAATMDARFNPVQQDELDDLHYEVSVLHPPEAVESKDELDPDRYGVIITGPGGRMGVMLPQVPTLDTVEKQIRSTRLKVGIPLDAPIRIQRFEVDKFEEE